jgi:DNA-binding MarR family transcriptional regulator
MTPTSPWCFLTSHAQILICIGRDPEILLKDVAGQIGLTERAVQRMMRDLVNDGFVVRNRVGRRNRYIVLENKRLPHALEERVELGQALRLFGVELPNGKAKVLSQGSN